MCMRPTTLPRAAEADLLVCEKQALSEKSAAFQGAWSLTVPAGYAYTC